MLRAEVTREADRLGIESTQLRAEIGELALRRVIFRLCEAAPREVMALSAILQRNPRALGRHACAMVDAGMLRPKLRDNRTHPHHAYESTRLGFGRSEEG